MTLAVSHTFFNKKLDKFGHRYDANIKEMDLEKQKRNEVFPVAMKKLTLRKNRKSWDDGCSLSDMSQQILRQRIALIIEDNFDSIPEIDFALPVMKKCICKSSMKLYSV